MRRLVGFECYRSSLVEAEKPPARGFIARGLRTEGDQVGAARGIIVESGQCYRSLRIGRRSDLEEQVAPPVVLPVQVP